MKDITEILKGIKNSGELEKAFPALFNPNAIPLELSKTRKLTADEIEKLKTQGNSTENWNNILVTEDFTPDNIRNSRFMGMCILGKFSAKEIEVDDNLTLSPGIYNSTLKDSTIGNDVAIYNCGLISNYTIGTRTALLKNGLIHCTGSRKFGNGIEITIGNETGGREVLSFAELNIELAEIIATNRANPKLLKDYEEFIKEYGEHFNSGRGVISCDAKLIGNDRIVDVLIGRGTIIKSSTLVENCSILSSPEEYVSITNGAYIKNACIQWGCSIDTMAIVEDSVLTEHSHVERHGKVTHSIIGPNTGIAEGEVTSSLVGPFVGFHHQSLLISAIWPEGKGNVGYGANVGSNHTSKAPDQEILCGEGTFFGLGVNIKFPTDFSNAPYSIIATGVSALPQRVEFPFSLINTPSNLFPGVSPAYNEIFPGWVLSDNIFTVRRNEGKYKKRNKAKRSRFVFEVFRPEIVDRMIEARKKLLEIEEKKEIYLDRDIKGLGKNYLQEKNRVKAIDTYTFYIHYYALKGLNSAIEEAISKGQKISEETIYNYEVEEVTEKPVTLAYWEHQKTILKMEKLTDKTLKENLLKLLEMEEQIAENTQKSKEKDDRRGRRIINDYAETHVPAQDDPFVVETWEEYKKLKERVYTYGILS